jgi:hypothetical protein
MQEPSPQPDQPEEKEKPSLPPAPRRRRRTRRDKNTIMATERDLWALRWIADQYACRLDHLRVLLSRAPGAPMQGPQLALTTLKDQLERWRKAGWVEYGRYLAAQPGWCWATKRGLRLVGMDAVYEAQAPAESRYKHIWANNEVRLLWGRYEFEGAEWINERRLITEQLGSKKKRSADIPLASIRISAHNAIPDAVCVAGGNAWVDAIEVQLSALSLADMRQKVQRVMEAEYTETLTGEEYEYDKIHFYVQTEAARDQLKVIQAEMADAEEQERLRIHLRNLSYKWSGWPSSSPSSP